MSEAALQARHPSFEPCETGGMRIKPAIVAAVRAAVHRESVAALALRYGLSPRTVESIVNGGSSYAHLGRAPRQDAAEFARTAEATARRAVEVDLPQVRIPRQWRPFSEADGVLRLVYQAGRG